VRTVRDDDGKRYVLLKQSDESSLVRDPESGDRRHVPNADLEPVEGESPLATAARSVPEPVRAVLGAVQDDRALGLLIELDDRGPVAVRTLLDGTDLCESHLHGLLAELRAAGLVSESDAGGRRGYDTTERAETALSRLRG
jgi:hypothetical protein